MLSASCVAFHVEEPQHGRMHKNTGARGAPMNFCRIKRVKCDGVLRHEELEMQELELLCTTQMSKKCEFHVLVCHMGLIMHICVAIRSEIVTCGAK